MKKKVFILIAILFLLTGCSKYDGAWCKYTEVFSTLIITNDNITEKELDYLVSVIKKLDNYKSYDVIDDIEGANTAVSIYFKNKEGMNNSELVLKNIKGVSKVELNSFLVVKEKIIIDGKKYTYGNELDNVDAYLKEGKFKKHSDYIELDNGMNFYYKNDYLCSDKECNNILKKSSNNKCE